MADFTPPTTPVSSEAAAAPAGPSNLRLRIIYGLIGAAMLLSCVWFSPWTFGLFFAGVQAVMLREFYRMMRAGGYAPAAWIGIGANFLFLPIVYFALATSSLTISNSKISPELFQTNADGKGVLIQKMAESQLATDFFTLKLLLLILLLLPIVLIVREIIVWPKYKQPFSNVGSTLLGLIYVSIPMSLLGFIAVDLKYGVYDYRRVVALLFLIWASDIGAYIAGKSFGKHKMAPSISPGKTWEGWAGGFLLTLVIGWAMGYFLPDVPLTHRLVAAGVVAVFAPLGDLAESMLKRSVGVKDSGTFLPGHGGLLDRFDAFLLVLPVLALLQLLAG